MERAFRSTSPVMTLRQRLICIAAFAKRSTAVPLSWTSLSHRCLWPMSSFSEAWLREYQQRMASVKSPSVSVPTEHIRIKMSSSTLMMESRESIAFVLAKPLPLWNSILRTHRYGKSGRRKQQQQLSAEIARMLPTGHREPFEFASITITRYSVGTPDPDGICVKMLLDCLVVRTEKNPDGLGLIRNDDQAHLSKPVVNAVRVSKRVEQRTEVRIDASVPQIAPQAGRATASDSLRSR